MYILAIYVGFSIILIYPTSLSKISKLNVVSWCGSFMETYSPYTVLGISSETLRKLCPNTVREQSLHD